MQKLITRRIDTELVTRVDQYQYKVRRDARERKKNRYKDKIVSIVQANRGVNAKPFLSTHCSVTIPHTLSKLLGIKQGSLVSWDLATNESNALILHVLPEEQEGDSS
jgi:hypothetical protein